MKHGLAFFFAFVAVGVHAASTWYVDAIGGNDANDGKTTATAVKTLKAAMEIPLLADVEPVGGHLVFDKTDYVVNGKGISFAWTRIHSDRADARVKISATRSMWLNIMPVRTNFSTLEPFWVKVW